MTRAKDRPWLCRHQHPMFRKPDNGHWICHTCNEINRYKGKIGYCVNGHKRMVGIECRVCKAYTQTPWHRVLDENGSARCDRGHLVSHRDSSVAYIRGKNRRARFCRQCLDDSVTTMRARTPEIRKDVCRNKLHPRTEENTKYIAGVRQCKPCWEKAHAESLERQALRREKKSGLKASHVDWVVVERVLARGTMPYIRRGNYNGLTDGERWVAYCTFVANAGGKHPEELYGEPGYDAMQLYQLSHWRSIGTKRRWKVVTLADIRSIIHTEEYLTGRFIRRYA